MALRIGVLVSAVMASTSVVLASPAGATSGAAVATAKTKVVKVKLTDAGCPAKISVPAGPVNFKVSNDNADAVTEFEVLNGDRILGEVENIAPGLSGQFSLTLKAGTYTTKCTGGDKREKGQLVVTGTAATTLTTAQQAAVDQYRAYVVGRTNQLVAAATAFANAVVAGDVATAKVLYGPARVPYETIEPVAEVFGDLDPRIDARAGDVPAKSWGGFHKIEQALYVNNTTTGMAPVAQQLVADVTQLQSLVPSVELEPATIANGAVELLNEVSASKITGEEERYSHIDLVDFAANVAGSKAAFDAVKPLLSVKNATLANTIETQFAAVATALAPYRQGTGFVLYTALTKSDTKALSSAIDALAEPLSKVAKQLVGQ
jgi:iron uptake system component EfeO